MRCLVHVTVLDFIFNLPEQMRVRGSVKPLGRNR
jgi:hypothetical protein